VRYLDIISFCRNVDCKVGDGTPVIIKLKELDTGIKIVKNEANRSLAFNRRKRGEPNEATIEEVCIELFLSHK